MEAVKEGQTAIQFADQLHDIENQIRVLETQRDVAKTYLAHALVVEQLDTVVGTYAQTYKLSRPNTRHQFNLPAEEFTKLGIFEECTEKPVPKINKSKMDDLLKRRRIDDDTVRHWIDAGYYVIERSDEITVRQVQTKLDDFKAASGF